LNVKYFSEDEVLLFEFTEEIDHHVSERIRKRMDYEIQRMMPKKVVLDFKLVKFMDSAGIGLILGRYKNASLYKSKMELVNVNKKIRKIFEMSGLLKIIDIDETFSSEQTG
jgi:stage II sporulation protein AA (anti-sigma F factor antagonist)